jgi:diadenosine tetraphosphate (Ap4A) HIT family hydrolase
MSSSDSSNFANLKTKEKRLLYEDSVCAVFLAEPPTTLGHLKIISKKDGALEHHSDAETERIFVLANVCASALFEMLGAQGTNIILDEWVRDKEPHVVVHIIARFAEDGMSYQWQPKQMHEPELEELSKKIKHQTVFINMKEKKLPQINLDEQSKPRSATSSETSRLRRVP